MFDIDLNVFFVLNETKYSRMDQVKFVKDSFVVIF